MRHVRGARSQSRAAHASAYECDDYALDRSRCIDCTSPSTSASAFEAHALARGCLFVVVAGCANGGDDARDGVVRWCAMRGVVRRAVWCAIDACGGVTSACYVGDDDARAKDDELFAFGCANGDVYVYTARVVDAATSIDIQCVHRLASSERLAPVTRIGVVRDAASRRILACARGGSVGDWLSAWHAPARGTARDAPFVPCGERGRIEGWAKASPLFRGVSRATSLGRGTWDVVGSRIYAVAADAKSVVCVNILSSGDRGGEMVWQSRREPGRQTFLAGVASLRRNRVATCSCAELVSGTTYAAPDSPIKIVILDADDGVEINRFVVEGLGATNVFIDCGSMRASGENIFLAHRDGTVWVINSGNGAIVTTLHPPLGYADTSGHRRTLPSLLALSPSGEEMHGVTCDGGVAHCWRVDAPRAWSRRSHRFFPRAFKRVVREILLCVHAVAAAPARAMSRLDLYADIDAVDEIDRAASTPWVRGFVDVAAHEPALLEMILARLASAEYGCDVTDGDYGDSI